MVKEESTKRDQADASENTTINRRIRDFTGALAMLGFIQIVFVWLGFRLTKQSADAATEGVYITRKALEASEESGKENLALTRQAADAATKSAETGKMALELTERADIALDAITIKDIPLMRTSGIDVVYKNVGRTRCTIVSTFLGCMVTEDLTNKPATFVDTPMNVLMGSGQGGQIVANMALAKGDPERVKKGEINLYVWGLIKYIDVFGNKRETCFSRRWDNGGSIFVFLDDPSRNYAT